MPMSSEWITEIKDRLARATPGPWRALPPECKKWVLAEDVSDEQWRANHTNDAAFIAHAPEDIAALLALVEEQQRQIDTLNAGIDRIEAAVNLMAEGMERAKKGMLKL